MDVTILGSGSLLPQVSRAGQSIVVTVEGESIPFDCGPMTIEQLLENEFRLRDLTNVFTHQHMEYNASFFHFALTSWMYRRRDERTTRSA